MLNPFRFLIERYHSLNIRPPITAVLIGGTFVLLAALVNLLIVAVKTTPQAHVASAKSVEPPSARQAKPTDPYEFASAVIRSLARAADARQTLVSTQTTGDIVTDTLKTMTDARISINQLGDAKIELARFQGSENRAVATAVEGFETAYDVVTDAIQKGLVVQEKIVTVEDDKELMSLTSELSKHLAQAHEGWKLLAYATALAAHALIQTR